jgi:hypothetical protein
MSPDAKRAKSISKLLSTPLPYLTRAQTNEIIIFNFTTDIKYFLVMMLKKHTQ